SHDLEFWDDVSVPAHFLMPEGSLPIVPVLTNCVAPPLPTPKRSWALGSFVRRFIEGRPAHERIALIATGGISHWIGVPNTGHKMLCPTMPARFLTGRRSTCEPGRNALTPTSTARPPLTTSTTRPSTGRPFSCACVMASHTLILSAL